MEYLTMLLVLEEVTECLWFIYINLRQKRKLMDLRRVPDEFSSVYTLNCLIRSRTRATSRISYDILLTLIDTLIYSCACLTNVLPSLWLWSKRATERRFLTKLLFASALVTSYWAFKSLLSIFLHKFIILKEPLCKQDVMEWLSRASKAYVSLLKDNLPVTLMVVFLLPYIWQDSDVVLASLAGLCYVLVYAYRRRTKPRQPTYWSMPNSKLKLRLAVVASLLGFSPQQVYSLDRWCNGDEWRPSLEGEPGPTGQASALVQRFYQEEAGGGHAKTCDVSQVMAYTALGLAFSKYMYPMVMFTLSAIKMILKILLSFRLLSVHRIYESFGFYEEKPLLVGLFINFYIVLSLFEKAWRWLELYTSHKFYEAGDRLVVSLGLGKHLALALLKMDARHCVSPAADSLYYDFYSSRPPLAHRLRYLNFFPQQ